jgi:hypothetical protein
MTAALLTAHCHAHPGGYVTAVEATVATMRAVCMRTLAQHDARAAAVAAEAAGAAPRTWLSDAWAAAPPSTRTKGGVPAFTELCLVQSRDVILAPPVVAAAAGAAGSGSDGAPLLRARPLPEPGAAGGSGVGGAAAAPA